MDLQKLEEYVKKCYNVICKDEFNWKDEFIDYFNYNLGNLKIH